MKFLLQYNIVILQVRRITVMVKIFLNHLICNISGTPNSITYCPEMHSQISFTKLRVFFLKATRCSPFQAFYKFANTLRRTIFNVDMYMIFTNYTFQNSHIFSVTYLLYQAPAPYLDVSLKYLKTIFCNTNNMCSQNRHSMPHSSVLFHNTKIINCVATGSLALKVHSFN